MVCMCTAKVRLRKFIHILWSKSLLALFANCLNHNTARDGEFQSHALSAPTVACRKQPIFCF